MHTIDTKFWLILSRSKNFVVFLNWNQHCWDRWHAKITVAVVLAIEICVELVFICEMTLPIPIIPIPSDRQIMAVPIFRSPFFRQLRGASFLNWSFTAMQRAANRSPTSSRAQPRPPSPGSNGRSTPTHRQSHPRPQHRNPPERIRTVMWLPWRMAMERWWMERRRSQELKEEEEKGRQEKLIAQSTWISPYLARRAHRVLWK